MLKPPLSSKRGKMPVTVPFRPAAYAPRNILTEPLQNAADADIRLWSSPWTAPSTSWVDAASLDGYATQSVKHAPSGCSGALVKLVRKFVPKKIKKAMQDFLKSPESSKPRVADAIAIGAFAAYTPIPFTSLLVAGAFAKILKRDPALAILGTLYHNVFTMLPLLMLQMKVGEAVMPENDLPKIVIEGVTVDPAAFGVGLAIMAPLTALAARLGTMLLYDRVKTPVFNLIKIIVNDENSAEPPLAPISTASAWLVVDADGKMDNMGYLSFTGISAVR